MYMSKGVVLNKFPVAHHVPSILCFPARGFPVEREFPVEYGFLPSIVILMIYCDIFRPFNHAVRIMPVPQV